MTLTGDPMLWALLFLNIALWLGVLTYGLRLIPALRRRWRAWAAIAGVAAAAAVSVASYRHAEKSQVRVKALRHYHAGIDGRKRGNLEEAERELRRAVELQPGHPEAKRALEELKAQQKPAEKREVRRETRVDQTAAIPSPAAPASSGEPAAPPAPPANAPPPPPGRPGEKPKPAAHLPSPFEIVHYALDVDIDPAKHSLDATADVRVRSRGKPVPTLDFSLNPGFKPDRIQVDGAPATFRHTNDLLAVTPARPLLPGKVATVTVHYRRTGPAILQESGDLISLDGTYLRSETRWYPATGELDFRSPVRVRARVPSGFSVVSVGALKSIEKDGKSVRYHWETDRFASMVSLAAARYVQQSVVVPPPAGVQRGGLKITCYTFPKHRDRAAAFLKEAAAMTRFLERLLGPYPYEKLAVVEIPLFPGGYGTTSFVMLIDKSFESKKLDREFLAHEIAHQWWGNSVFPQGLGAAWLTEAFANYSAWMYLAATTGNPRVIQKRVAQANREYFQAAAVKGDQPIYETDPYQPVGAAEQILYEKGAVVLHMLRRHVGEKAFFRILGAFAADYRFGKATIEDFRRISERESGQELGWFFEQWLGRTGGLKLAYSFTTEIKPGPTNEAVLVVSQPAPPYRARMKVVLGVDNSAQGHEIELTEAHKPYRFPVRGKVHSVLFDPDNWYLMENPKWIVPDG